MTKGHNQGIINDKRSQFSIVSTINNDIVNDKKGYNVVNDKKDHNVVNDSFAHKSDSFLVGCIMNWYHNRRAGNIR